MKGLDRPSRYILSRESVVATTAPLIVAAATLVTVSNSVAAASSLSPGPTANGATTLCSQSQGARKNFDRVDEVSSQVSANRAACK